MPQHHPEDRVRVKNIINPDYQDLVQTFYITRLRKTQAVDVNGQPITREVPYEKEIEWDFRDGFFFMWGGRAYVLRPGEVKSYPRFIAEKCAKEQIQHILNFKHNASKRMSAEGLPIYDRNILNNQVLKKQLFNQIIVGVEEWYNGADEDFDAIINKKFGGDVEGYLNEDKVDKQDYELPTEDIEDSIPVEVKAPKAVTKSADAEVQKLRDECDTMGVEWMETDNAKQLKDKLIKMMA